MAWDRLDIRILNHLQGDAGIPLRALAARVHASPATCQRRIARLKGEGVLTKQVALVDRSKIGPYLAAFISVELEAQNDALLRAFERRVAAEAEVMACYEVSGEFDFLLQVQVGSMAEFHAFTRRVCSTRQGVRNFKSTFVMSCSKSETRMLLPEPEA